MNTPPSPICRPLVILSAAAIAFFASGCSSDQPEGRAESSRHRQSHLPPLTGKDTFFNGQITAELNVGHGTGFAAKPAKEGEEQGYEHKHHGGGGFRMGGGGGEGGHGRRHGGGDGDSGGETGGVSDPVERQQMSAMRHAANPNPPVMIHLRFTNNGPTHAVLLIADFLSPLGNFVVEPEKLELDPGQTVEVEPMTSRLAGEISGATVTLALRLGGQGEKKNIELTVAPDAVAGIPPTEAPAETK